MLRFLTLIRYRKLAHVSCFRVIYNEVIQTSKYYMRDVTAIESAWLLELAPHFYQQGTVGMNRAHFLKLPVSLLLCSLKCAFILQFNAENCAPQQRITVTIPLDCSG